MGNIKKTIKRVVPMTKHDFEVKSQTLQRKFEKTETTLSNVENKVSDVKSKVHNVESKVSNVESKVSNVENKISSIDKLLFNIENKLSNEVCRREDLAEIKVGLSGVKKSIDKIDKKLSEVLWAQIFDDTINDSDWLKIKDFSPGRWAVGYPYLYIVFRILNEIRPKSILELGLGQSTKMISQYAAFHDSSHTVVEHDKNWITFFNENFALPSPTKVSILELTEQQYLDEERTFVYKDFSEKFSNAKYDFISIDGPFGGADKNYSRIDTLTILPECLCDTFVIIIDDYDRRGEQRTVEEIKRILESSKISFKAGVYSGEKSVCVIVSEDLSFVCSL